MDSKYTSFEFIRNSSTLPRRGEFAHKKDSYGKNNYTYILYANTLRNDVGTARLRTTRLRTTRLWTTRLRGQLDYGQLVYAILNVYLNVIYIIHRPIVRGWARAPPEMPRPKKLKMVPLLKFFGFFENFEESDRFPSKIAKIFKVFSDPYPLRPLPFPLVLPKIFHGYGPDDV